MIGGHEIASTPIGMANNVSFPLQQPTPLAGNHFMPRSVFDLKHSIFAGKIVNKTAFGHKTWVIDTSASDHIVCSVTLMHSFTSISQCVVELPNGESAQDLIHWWMIGKGEVSNGLYLLQNITSALAVSPSSLQDYLSQFRSTH
ncbi:hypothetical protein SO802_002445 [Lithocarpus litseifolius]|uniref:Uncharacterized protein n=1 Tax=Lithocarpus litseifolius TaxID=425828 RepID=A0AAW2E2L5_9ROSI